MACIREIRPNWGSLLTLRPQWSTSGGLIYSVTEEVEGALSSVKSIFEDLEYAHSRGDADSIAWTMKKLQKKKIWVFENDVYVDYREIGVPCWKENHIRFKDWEATGFRNDFPEIVDDADDNSEVFSSEDFEPSHQFYTRAPDCSLQDALERLRRSVLSQHKDMG